jgi:hypothetical protein
LDCRESGGEGKSLFLGLLNFIEDKGWDDVLASVIHAFLGHYKFGRG